MIRSGRVSNRLGGRGGNVTELRSTKGDTGDESEGKEEVSEEKGGETGINW